MWLLLCLWGLLLVQKSFSDLFPAGLQVLPAKVVFLPWMLFYCCCSTTRVLLHLGPSPLPAICTSPSFTTPPPRVTSLLNWVSQPSTFQVRLCPSGRIYLLDISEMLRVEMIITPFDLLVLLLQGLYSPTQSLWLLPVLQFFSDLLSCFIWDKWWLGTGWWQRRWKELDNRR